MELVLPVVETSDTMDHRALPILWMSQSTAQKILATSTYLLSTETILTTAHRVYELCYVRRQSQSISNVENQKNHLKLSAGGSKPTFSNATLPLLTVFCAKQPFRIDSPNDEPW